MGNKSSRARSATAGPRTAQPPPPQSSAQPVHRPLIQTPQQQARNSTAGMVVAAVTATASHRPRSATAGAAAATPAVPEIIVYSEASFAKFPASHRPSGRVYPLKSCRWPPDTLATMVTAKLIAPFATGFEDPASPTGQQLEECPLCMLYYSTGLNNCVTCHQGMCSECFATLLDAPAQKPSAAGSKCPFCNVAPFKHLYTGPKSIEELRKIRDEADEMSRLEKAQLDAAVAEEHARLERKKQGLPPLSPPAQPAPQNAESPPPPLPASTTPPRTSPVSHTQHAVPPPRSPDDDLFDLPSEIRHAIVTEEFRQRLITYYRHKRPDGIAHVDEIVKRYGSDRQDSVIAAAVAKYGDEPSLEEMRQDVVLRLVAYYKSKKGSISPSDASAMVANFGNAPWKAMARAVVERGRETHPPPVPKPKSETNNNNTNSVSAAPPVPLQAAAEETTPPAATPPRAVEPPRPVTSPTTASPVSTAEAVMARLPTETRRQTILTLLRLRRPSLVPRVMELFTAMPHTRLTDTHVDTVAVECGVPGGVESVQDAAREDITLRLKHYFSAVMPQRPLTEADTLLEKYQGREPVLFAGVVIKYGPEPPGAPLTPGAVPLLNRSDDAIVGALLTSMLTTDDLDPELAIALRCSVESL